jgi:hypothetical protein
MVLVRALISLMLVVIILIVTVSLFSIALEFLLGHFWGLRINCKSLFEHHSTDRKKPLGIRDREVLLLPQNMKLVWKKEQDCCEERASHERTVVQGVLCLWQNERREDYAYCGENAGRLENENKEGREEVRGKSQSGAI